MKKTIEEYNRIQDIRSWNAKLQTPPLCTKHWNNEDFQAWLDLRNPLPPFKEWIKQ